MRKMINISVTVLTVLTLSNLAHAEDPRPPIYLPDEGEVFLRSQEVGIGTTMAQFYIPGEAKTPPVTVPPVVKITIEGIGPAPNPWDQFKNREQTQSLPGVVQRGPGDAFDPTVDMPLSAKVIADPNRIIDQPKAAMVANDPNRIIDPPRGTAVAYDYDPQVDLPKSAMVANDPYRIIDPPPNAMELPPMTYGEKAALLLGSADQLNPVQIGAFVVTASILYKIYQAASLGGRKAVLAAVIDPTVIAAALGQDGYKVPGENKSGRYQLEDALAAARELQELDVLEITPAQPSLVDAELLSYFDEVVESLRMARIVEQSVWENEACTSPGGCI